MAVPIVESSSGPERGLGLVGLAEDEQEHRVRQSGENAEGDAPLPAAIRTRRPDRALRSAQRRRGPRRSSSMRSGDSRSRYSSHAASRRRSPATFAITVPRPAPTSAIDSCQRSRSTARTRPLVTAIHRSRLVRRSRRGCASHSPASSGSAYAARKNVAVTGDTAASRTNTAENEMLRTPSSARRWNQPGATVTRHAASAHRGCRPRRPQSPPHCPRVMQLLGVRGHRALLASRRGRGVAVLRDHPLTPGRRLDVVARHRRELVDENAHVLAAAARRSSGGTVIQVPVSSHSGSAPTVVVRRPRIAPLSRGKNLSRRATRSRTRSLRSTWSNSSRSNAGIALGDLLVEAGREGRRWLRRAQQRNGQQMTPVDSIRRRRPPRSAPRQLASAISPSRVPSVSSAALRIGHGVGPCRALSRDVHRAHVRGGGAAGGAPGSRLRGAHRR